MLRSFLVQIRKAFYEDQTKALTRTSIVAAILLAIGTAMDFTLPYGPWWNTLRAAVVLPTGIVSFIVAYMISLRMHDKRIREDSEWEPYRTRFSPRWRQRISAIIGAVLLVAIYAASDGVGYSITATAVVVVVIGLLAFLRMTRKEQLRSDYSVPDPRDTRIDDEVEKRDKERELLAEEKRRLKQLKRTRILKGEKADELQEDFDEEAQQAEKDSESLKK